MLGFLNLPGQCCPTQSSGTTRQSRLLFSPRTKHTNTRYSVSLTGWQLEGTVWPWVSVLYQRILLYPICVLHDLSALRVACMCSCLFPFICFASRFNGLFRKSGWHFSVGSSVPAILSHLPKHQLSLFVACRQPPALSSSWCRASRDTALRKSLVEYYST